MGSLRSYEKLNQYLSKSPERVFFRFTGKFREEPLSQYKKKIYRGEAGVNYNITPFGIYSFPFKYFFLNKRVESLSDFFHVLSKEAVKERIEKYGSEELYSKGDYSGIYLADLGVGAALFAEDAPYVRFLVISPNAKVWTIGENDPFLDGSKALSLYKNLLGLKELPPIYEIVPLSVRKFTPLGPFSIFPSLFGKFFSYLNGTWGIDKYSYNFFEEVVALVFKNPGRYRSNLELALKELLLSREVEEYEFYCFEELSYLITPSRLSKNKFLRKAQHYLPFTSFLISFYLSMDKILGNEEKIKGISFYGLRDLVISEFKKIMFESEPSNSPFSELFGYDLVLDLAKNFKKLPKNKTREDFLKVRREIVNEVIRKIPQYSEKQVTRCSKIISSLINDLFSERTRKKPGPSEIISLSLGYSEGFVDQMKRDIPSCLHVFYISTNPLALLPHLRYDYYVKYGSLRDIYDSIFREELIRKIEHQFLKNLSGASSLSYFYADTHEKVLEWYESSRYNIRYGDLILKLGFQVIVDPGYGLIHQDEPVQAVILDDSVLEYDDYFENFPSIYWKVLERFLVGLKVFGKNISDPKSAILRSIEEIESRGYRYGIGQSKKDLLLALINLYLDFSFISSLLLKLGFEKSFQSKVKRVLAYKIKKVAENINHKVVKKIMSKAIINFVLSNEKFPPEKMKKAFQEIKKVLSTESR